MIQKHNIKQFKDFLESGTTKASITKVVLVAVLLGVLPFVALGAAAAGNAVQLSRSVNSKNRYSKIKVNRALSYLKKQKMIEFVSEKNGITTLRITKKGETTLKSFSIDLLTIQKPKKWDGKWRVVMFDLPVRYKQARNALRYKLKQIGFKQLQKSVWVYPYPCTDELLFVADYYKVQSYIEIMTVDNMLNGEKLRHSFSVK